MVAVCWHWHQKTCSYRIMDLQCELHFPHGLSPGKDTAGTCPWQQILGNSNIAVVLLLALAVPEPWKERAVPVSQCGVSRAGQFCPEEAADYLSSNNRHLTFSVGA